MPVKRLAAAKSRLAATFSPEQRAHFSALMCADVLAALAVATRVQGVTVVGSDPLVADLAREHGAEFMPRPADAGYSVDATAAIEVLAGRGSAPIAVLPADVPQVAPAELDALAAAAVTAGCGIVLVPALIDGGTNGLVFAPPLPIPLCFGPQSFAGHCQAATARGIAIHTAELPGLQRDIDRPEDVRWLAARKRGGRAWAWVRRASG